MKRGIRENTEKIITLIISFFGIIQVLLNLPIFIFIVIISFLIAYTCGVIVYLIIIKRIKRFWLKEKKKIKRKIKDIKQQKNKLSKISDADKKCEIVVGLYYYDSKKNDINNNIKQCEATRSKVVKSIKTNLSVIGFVSVCIVMKVVVQFFTINEISFGGQKAESQYTNNNEKELNLLSKEGKQSFGSKEEVLLIDSGKKYVKFKLEYPNGYPKIDGNEFDNIYNLTFYIDQENLYEIIKDNIIIWMRSFISDSQLDKALTSSGQSTEYYAKIESNFLMMMESQNHLIH